MNIEKFIERYIGNKYQNRFDNILNLKVYENKSENIRFSSYIFNNTNLNSNDLIIFKSNVTKNGLNSVMNVIKTIDILELEYSKNKKTIEILEKLLLFYLLE